MASEDETRAAKHAYLAWRVRTDTATEVDDWMRERVQRARLGWLACAPSEPAPWWPGAWRIRLASGRLNLSCGVHNVGIWRTRADADIYLLDPVKDPAVAGQKGGWRQVVRDMLTGATTEWATVIDGVYPVALDDDFWADVDNGHPLAGI